MTRRTSSSNMRGDLLDRIEQEVRPEPTTPPAGTTPVESAPVTELDATPADPVADVEPVSEYDSWRTQQEEWLAAEREDLIDSYNDRGSAVDKVGAGNEKQRLLQLATRFERITVADLQEVIEKAKAALDAGEFDADREVHNQVGAILHHAQQVLDRRMAAMAEPESAPAQEPDAMPADPVADVESAPAQEPDAMPADPVADVESDTIAEPDAMPADPVADVESDTIAEPDAMPADPVADVESDTIAEPDAMPADPVVDVESGTIAEPDAVPAESVADVESDPVAEPEPVTDVGKSAGLFPRETA